VIVWRIPRQLGKFNFTDSLSRCNLDGTYHESGPPSLVTSTNAGSVISVEVFVEQDEIAPVRIGLKLVGIAIHRTMSLRVTQKNFGIVS
jgi:hypothetical protein